MKTLTSITACTTTKCAELHRHHLTGVFAFRCSLCDESAGGGGGSGVVEFATAAECVRHINADHFGAVGLDGTNDDEHDVVAVGPPSPVSSVSPSSSGCSSAVCITTLSTCVEPPPLKRSHSSSSVVAAATITDADGLPLAAKRLRSNAGEFDMPGESACKIDHLPISRLFDVDNEDELRDDDDDEDDDDDGDVDEDEDGDDAFVRPPSSSSPHPYSCQRCGQTFGFNYAFKNHPCAVSRSIYAAATAAAAAAVAGSSSQPDLTCDVCGHRAADARALTEHTDTHGTGEPCVCAVCAASFDTRHELKQHRRERHPKQPASASSSSSPPTSGAAGSDEKPHKCHVCGRRYAKSAALAEHVRVHTGDKPFRCFVCGKGFARRVLVRQHERIHTGETPYRCRHCPQTFTYGASRRAHEKNKHPERAV